MEKQQGYESSNIASRNAGNLAASKEANKPKDDGYDKALSREAVSLGLPANSSASKVAQARAIADRHNKTEDQKAVNNTSAQAKKDEIAVQRYEEIIAKPIAQPKKGLFGTRPSLAEERRYNREVGERSRAQSSLDRLFK